MTLILINWDLAEFDFVTTAELIKQRFNELSAKSRQVASSAHQTRMGPVIVDNQKFHEWATSVLALLERVFGTSSVHFVQFSEKLAAFRGYQSNYENCAGIFHSAKEDYEGGYVLNLQAAITGEILADFVQLAKAALREGNKDVAAVLASAALEDALKRYARKEGLNLDDQVMQQVVNALKAKGFVAGAQKTLLDSMPKLRDYAMHANWDRLAAEDVSSIIGFVEQFLIAKFS